MVFASAKDGSRKFGRGGGNLAAQPKGGALAACRLGAD